MDPARVCPLRNVEGSIIVLLSRKMISFLMHLDSPFCTGLLLGCGALTDRLDELERHDVLEKCV